jgi:hypothetical protein
MTVRPGTLPMGWITDAGFFVVPAHDEISMFLDDDEIDEFIKGDNEILTEAAIVSGWIRVSPEGFEGKYNDIKRHSEHIMDLIVDSRLPLDRVVYFDVHGGKSIVLRVRDIFDSGLIGAMNRELRSPAPRPFAPGSIYVRAHKRRKQ